MADGIVVAAQRLLQAGAISKDEVGFVAEYIAYDKTGHIIGVMASDGSYIVKAATKDNTLDVLHDEVQ